MSLILIADDEPDICEFMRTLVGFFGHQSIVVQDGQKAYSAALQFKPDLILMDLAMPKLNGFMAISRLKSDPATLGIPIIAFSGLYMDSPVRTRLIKAGCSDFLPKPIDTDTLYRSMQVAITGKKPEPPKVKDAPLKIRHKSKRGLRSSIRRLIDFLED